MKLRRIDSELVRRGLAKSRAAAAQMIEDGRVKLDGQVVLKPARQMDPAQAIVVEESDDPEYVSRGAHKLAGALDALGDKAPLIKGVVLLTQVLRRVVSPTCCCGEAQHPSLPSTSGMASSHGSCRATRAWRCTIGRTCAPLIRLPLLLPPNWSWGICRSFL